MINYIALTLTEMGIGKIELGVIGAVILIFPILFIYISKKLSSSSKKSSFMSFKLRSIITGA